MAEFMAKSERNTGRWNFEGDSVDASASEDDGEAFVR